ncbi:hypothetical protein HYC85_026763 [Camellia sinensis]|uniref:Uncharacterized protein n=1 Tax=Camellia sinensis TaxID=4442 RepID=A0A7J7G8G3_CAMSI|nr:hypothetical protein HYC85_026763 [Camellia sinensis]
MGFFKMIAVVVIVLFLIVAIAACLFGRARGRTEATGVPQYYGPSVPPFAVQSHGPQK